MAVGDVTSTTSTSSTLNFVDPDETGFNALKSEDFLNLLLVQLQNQDPTEPTSNAELLNQLSTMQSLSSNQDLSATLEKLNSTQTETLTAQQLSNAANLIGKNVDGAQYDGLPVSGVADRAFLSEGEVYIGIGSSSIPLSKVSGINLVV